MTEGKSRKSYLGDYGTYHYICPDQFASHLVCNMKLLLLFFWGLLCCGINTAQTGAGNRFNDLHAKSISSSPLKLSDASYDDLVTQPRDYTAVVLLTALEARFGCQLCREFQPEWDLIGKSWIKGDRLATHRVLFGTLDFSDGKATFQRVCITHFWN